MWLGANYPWDSVLPEAAGRVLAEAGRVLVRGAGGAGGSFEGLAPLPFLIAGGGAELRRASGARLGAALGRTLVRPRVGLIESFIESLRAIPDVRLDWLALPALGRNEGGAFDVREVREVVFAGIVTSRAAAAPVRRCVVARLFVWSSEPPTRRPRGDEPPKPATSTHVPARHAP